MQIVRTVAQCREFRRGVAAPVGFVPTMGALHVGHVSLATAARGECATVIASIFVNPKQFGPNEDLESYPRDEPGDLHKLEQAGVDLVFIPGLAEIYPEGHQTTVRVGCVTGVLEGERRPGHFDGVATVVAKLFGIVQPDRAYFGQKDAQQLIVVRSLVRDLALPVEVVGCPTVREPDGLALSSRNVYLSTEERSQAASLSQGLRRAEDAFADGVRDADTLRRMVCETIGSQPLAEIDYVSVAGAESLAELSGELSAPALCSVAVRFGHTRLIDNVVLTP